MPAPRLIVKRVSLDLINEPPAPIRQVMDPDALQSLARSISEVGLIEPIILTKDNGRYTIVAGHRRFLACRIAGRVDIASIVAADGASPVEALMLHENIERVDLSAGEEAIFFGRIYDQVGQDVDKVCEKVKRGRPYVEERLNLLRGDEIVLRELLAGKITFAVAKELNKVVDDGYRVTFLTAVLRGGASARVVAEWRARIPQHDAPQTGAPASPDTGPSAAPAAVRSAMTCTYCGSAEEAYLMELIYVHRPCLAILQRLIALPRREAANDV